MEKWGTCQSGALVMPVMGDVGGCIANVQSRISARRPFQHSSSGADTSTVPSSSELTLATMTRTSDLACYIYIEAFVNVNLCTLGYVATIRILSSVSCGILDRH